jgi:hypothetical protein
MRGAAGERRYLRHVLEMALPWGPYLDSLGADYAVEISKPLPPEIVNRKDLESVRCQSSRAAVWHLLVNSRVHPGTPACWFFNPPWYHVFLVGLSCRDYGGVS